MKQYFYRCVTARFTLTASVLLIVLTGCTAVTNQVDKLVRFIEGEDRVEMKGSIAEVTPLVLEDESVFLPPIKPAVADTIEQDEKLATAESPLAGQIKHTQVDLKEKTKNDSGDKKTPAVIAPAIASAIEPSAPEERDVINADITTKSKDNSFKTAPTKQEQEINLKVAQIAGTVKIVGSKVKDAISEQSIVTLMPINPSQKHELRDRASQSHVIDMRDKTYLPDHITIGVNDTVIFTNSDKIKHNVFSPSGKNAFDLGTYSAGKKRGVTLKDTGIVKVYCNIHPNMATFISVSDQGYSTVTDRQGHFVFNDVPVGDYKLKAWNIRGEVDQSFFVSEAGASNVSLNIVAQIAEVEKHQNKFGEEYKDKPALFNDEFY